MFVKDPSEAKGEDEGNSPHRWIKNMEAKNKKYITLAQAAKTSPYSQEYLSLLARQGKLQAKKFGRNWYITESALNDYLNNQGLKIVLPKHLFNTADKGKIVFAYPLTPAAFHYNKQLVKINMHMRRFPGC